MRRRVTVLLVRDVVATETEEAVEALAEKKPSKSRPQPAATSSRHRTTEAKPTAIPIKKEVVPDTRESIARATEVAAAEVTTKESEVAVKETMKKAATMRGLDVRAVATDLMDSRESRGSRRVTTKKELAETTIEIATDVQAVRTTSTAAVVDLDGEEVAAVAAAVVAVITLVAAVAAAVTLEPEPELELAKETPILPHRSERCWSRRPMNEIFESYDRDVSTMTKL